LAPGRNTLNGRTALEGKTVYVPDVLVDFDGLGPASDAVSSSAGMP
jgi:hypothetical protein